MNKLIIDYSSMIIYCIKPNMTVRQVKNFLSECAKRNGMSASDIHSAEERALTMYKDVNPSFIVSNVPLEPEVLDIMKLIRVLDVIDTFSPMKKREVFNLAWLKMMRTLAPKMDDLNYNILCELFSDPNINLNRYIGVNYAKERASEANSKYNTTENHILPVYKSSSVRIVYKDGEILHYALRTRMLKKKSKTVAFAYHGPQISIRIMRGLRYKAGMIMPAPIKEEYWDTEAEGMFFITNQRIGFVGLKSFSINISKLFYLTFEEEMLFIFKEGRENPYIIHIPNDLAEEPLSTISTLLNR